MRYIVFSTLCLLTCNTSSIEDIRKCEGALNQALNGPNEDLNTTRQRVQTALNENCERAHKFCQKQHKDMSIILHPENGFIVDCVIPR